MFELIKRIENKQLWFAHLVFTLLLAISMAATAFAEMDTELVITKQLDAAYVALEGKSATITFDAELGNEVVSYQWYESSDGSIENGVLIDGAVESSYTTDVFTSTGIRYYYCVATVGEKNVTSNVTVVANTGLPTLYVETPDHVEIKEKDKWVENASLSLSNAEEASWNFENVSMSIRGRGNTTWEYVKKTYSLKLGKEREIMGMPQHKRWVLVANYLDNSFLKNHIAFYLSEMFGMDYTVRGKFVDLVFNGVYRGLYWLGEAIKVDENRVNIDDGNKKMAADQDKDFLIEMDTHYDEVVKFTSPIRKIPYMIKNDDYMVEDVLDENGNFVSVISKDGQTRLERFQAKVEKLEKLLYPDYAENEECRANTNKCSAPDESYIKVIDAYSWAKFWIVNELMDNGEIAGPKSVYVTYETAKDVFKAGPVWDFDYCALQIRNATRLRSAIYFNSLFKSPLFKSIAKHVWEKYSSRMSGLEAEIEKMRNYLKVAAKVDSVRWGVHLDASRIERQNFDEYVDFLKGALILKKNLVENFVKTLSDQPKALTFINSSESVMTFVDGEFGGNSDFEISEDMDVDGVSFGREFTPGEFSALVLPFDVNTAKVNGVNMVLNFNGLKQRNGKTVVSMKKVWTKGVSENDADIKANTPYLVKMDETSLRIDGAVTLRQTVEPVAKVEGSDWEFHGTLGFKRWDEGDPDLGRVYGFAAEATDNIDVGRFVKAGTGAYIYPLRAYLLAPPKISGVRGLAGNTVSTMGLPENIDVVIEEDDVPATEPKTTVIGRFNTRTGEFKMNSANRVYDLKGRNVGNSANKARGAYYGKKTIK